jgi:tetratricopeptide (TPR) repeat protein
VDAINRDTLERALNRGDLAAHTAIAALLRRAAAVLPSAESADLARLLYDAATRSPELHRELAHWLAAVESGGHGTDGAPGTDGATTPAPEGEAAPAHGEATAPAHGNTVTGGAHAGIVQARSVGEIHWHTTAPRPEGPPVPRQLIAAPRQLAGRERDLAALEAIRADGELRAGPLVTVVSGPAGVGKTALVSYWLRGLGADFPDGQLYADLRGYALEGPTAAPEVLGMFVRAFGTRDVPSVPAERAALWRSVTAGRRIVLMLDNALSAAQVRPLLPGGEQSLVVVTSRRRLTGLGLEGAVFHQLGFLDAEASARILTQRVGARRAAAEPAAVRRVVERCGGLALAVCVAAARMAARPAQPLEATAAALDQEAEGLAGLRLGEDAAVRSALDASYRMLPPDAAALYRLLSALPFAGFGVPVAAAGAGLPPAEADRLVDELAEASLLEETEGGRYRFHDLVRLHARGLARVHDGEAGRTDAVRRALEWYLATTTAAETLISPSHRGLDRDYTLLSPAAGGAFATEHSALAWLAAEQQPLMAAVRTAAARDWYGLCWQLTDAMWPAFLRLRPYDLWVEAHRLGLEAARRAGDLPGELRMLTSGGAGLLNCGLPDEAGGWFGQALALARAAGDRLVEAQALHGLGQSHQLAGRLEPAADCFGRALRLREDIGYVRGAALSRISLGDTALSAGRPDAAAEALDRARTDLLALPDPYEAARALALLGRALGEIGRTDLAEARLRQAVEEFRARGAVQWEAHSLEFLGRLHQRCDRPDDALRAYERSLALYEGVGAPDAGRIAGLLAEVAARSGADPDADPDPDHASPPEPGAGPRSPSSGPAGTPGPG